MQGFVAINGECIHRKKVTAAYTVYILGHTVCVLQDESFTASINPLLYVRTHQY